MRRRRPAASAAVAIWTSRACLLLVAVALPATASPTSAPALLAPGLPQLASSHVAGDVMLAGAARSLRDYQDAAADLVGVQTRDGSLDRHDVVVGLHVCPDVIGGTTFEPLALNFPSNDYYPSHLIDPKGATGWIYATVRGVPGDRPVTVSITAMGRDGICLNGVTLDAVGAIDEEGALPRWLDGPCDSPWGYGQLPCSNMYVFELPPPTSTSSITSTQTTTTKTLTTTTKTGTTTTLTTTRTSTSTTATSTSTTVTASTTSTTASTTSTTVSITTTTTSTTTTSTATVTSTTTTTSTKTRTTSTTTTTTTIFVPISGAEAAVQASVPEAFSDELYVEVGVETINASELEDADDLISSYYGVQISERVKQLLGISDQDGEAQVDATLVKKDGEVKSIMLHFKVARNAKVPAKEIQQRFDFEKSPKTKEQFNQLLKTIDPPEQIYAEGGAFGGVLHFSSVNSVVYAILHNPAVAKAYKWYFPVGILLCLLVVVIIWRSSRTLVGGVMSGTTERTRGLLIMPIFVIATVFQTLILALKSFEKYMMLVQDCDKKRDQAAAESSGQCPPSATAMLTEICVFALPVGPLLICFIRWWLPRWRLDCQGSPTPRRTRAVALTPGYSDLRVNGSPPPRAGALVPATPPRPTAAAAWVPYAGGVLQAPPRPGQTAQLATPPRTGAAVPWTPQLLPEVSHALQHGGVCARTPAVGSPLVAPARSDESQVQVQASSSWTPPFVHAPVPGDRVEVLWKGRWVGATVLQDLRAVPPGQARWVVQCDNDPPGMYMYAKVVKPLPPPPEVEEMIFVESPRTLKKKRVSRIFNQYNVYPMESVMRRGQMLTWLVVRPTDVANSTEQLLLVLIDMALSFAVVMTSFFLLQKYEVPGKVTAWFPYKLIWELVIALILKKVFREVVLRGMLDPKWQERFTWASIICCVAYDVLLWTYISAAVEAMATPITRSISERMRVLDITVGAGLVNFLLSRFSVTLVMLLFSVYGYEPGCRHRYRRVVHLTNMRQVKTLLRELGPRAPRLRPARPPEESTEKKSSRYSGPLCDVESDVDEDADGSASSSRYPWKVDAKPQLLAKTAKKGIRQLRWRQLLVPLEPDFDASQFAKRTPSEAAAESPDQMSSVNSWDSDDLDGVHGLPVVPSDRAPVVVTVRWVDGRALTQFLVMLLDYILAVDDLLPVSVPKWRKKRRKVNACGRFCGFLCFCSRGGVVEPEPEDSEDDDDDDDDDDEDDEGENPSDADQSDGGGGLAGLLSER